MMEINHSQPVFVMLMGLPGSGKSTLRAGFPNTYIQLSTDDIIEDVAKWSVIWDQTNMTAKKRKKVLSRVPAGYYKILIEVTCDEDERQVRMKSREPDKIIPPHIDASMKQSRVEPSKGEGRDEIWVRRT